VKRVASARLGAYAGLAALGMLAAIALGRPELAAVGAPLAVMAAAGSAAARDPHATARLALSRDRAIEGELIPARLVVYAERAVERLDVELVMPANLRVAQGSQRLRLRLAAGEERVIELALEAQRWGALRVGGVWMRAQGPLGLVAFEAVHDQTTALRVYPHAERLRRLVVPLGTQASAGNLLAHRAGDGIELADLRAYVPGDAVRRIHWRASARRGALVVSERHPERNADVIVFLDSFADERAAGGSTLDDTVRAALALARGYLRGRDRVGLIGFGGVVRWLRAGSGERQALAIAEALIDTSVVLSYAWKDARLIPPRVLPPGALVIALTPLLDERAEHTLLDLRARGFDVCVFDIDPDPAGLAPRDELRDLAWRLWRLRHSAARARMERLGIAVTSWRGPGSIALPIEEVTAFRRRGRVARR